jgi:hypothetical protein
MGEFLNFYKRCMETGVLPANGLCGCADDERFDRWIFSLIQPTDEDFVGLLKSGMIAVEGGGYWGSGLSLRNSNYTSNQRVRGFTPLRQTLVLFMAALNNEL